MPTQDKRVRITVDLTSRQGSTVQRLSQEYGVSHADIIRDAAKLLIETAQLRRDGFKIGGWRQDGDGPKEYLQIVNGY